MFYGHEEGGAIMDAEQAKVEMKILMSGFSRFPHHKDDAPEELFRHVALDHKAGFINGRLCHPKLPGHVARRIETILTAIVPELITSGSMRFGLTDYGTSGTIDLFEGDRKVFVRSY